MAEGFKGSLRFHREVTRMSRDCAKNEDPYERIALVADTSDKLLRSGEIPHLGILEDELRARQSDTHLLALPVGYFFQRGYDVAYPVKRLDTPHFGLIISMDGSEAAKKTLMQFGLNERLNRDNLQKAGLPYPRLRI